LSEALPRPYLGTMTFGWSQASTPVGKNEAAEQMKRYMEVGGIEVDTARIYSGGGSEVIIGEAIGSLEGLKPSINIATKVSPAEPGGLSAQGIRAQVEASFKCMNINNVSVLYLHQPDTENGLVESLECVHQLVQEGKVGALGLSNYHAVEVERCISICKERGWTAPSVVQGLYNPLNRMVEEELLPLLRRNGVSFVSYNSMAAGLLTGKHKQGGEVAAGRFKDNPNYLPRFYTDPNFEAVENIRAACEAAGLQMVPATYAWLLHHSALDVKHGDGILLGASTQAQLEDNLAAFTDPVFLPEPVVKAFNDAWGICKEGAFFYWRSYSSDQPGRESMHPGASYNAKHGKPK